MEGTAQKSVAIATAMIGPSAWRTEAERDMSAADATRRGAEDNTTIGKMVDPVPTQREAYAELSNITAFEYMREVRVVANQLRHKLLLVNEDIKHSMKAKNILETQLAKIRTEMALNEKSRQLRKRLPEREQRQEDGVAAILTAERTHLQGLKGSVERNLAKVKNHLQKLHLARKRVQDVWKERSKVLDLVCQTTNSQPLPTDINTASYLRHALSAPARCGTPNGGSPPDTDNVGPLNAMTPEAYEALKHADEAMSTTAELACESRETTKKVAAAQDEARKAVARALEQKMAETAALSQKLRLSITDNRNSLHKTQRHYDRTNYSYSVNRGAEEYHSIPLGERLDRPLMRVYQRHPGTQVPEAGYIRKDHEKLADSLYNSSRHVAALKFNRENLDANLKDKKAALDVDSEICRMRRAKSFYV